MLAFEVMFLMALSVVAVVTIAAVGRPLAEAYAEKMKAKYRELAPEQETALRTRMEQLEEDLVEVRKQLQQLQETSEFAIKLIESSHPQIEEQRQARSQDTD